MKDFTQGNISRHIAAFSLPMLIGNLFQQFYSMADAAVVGNFISGNALAAVGTSMPLLGFLVAALIGLTTGSSILISQYFGAGRDEELSRTVSTSVIALFSLVLGVSLLGLFCSPFLLRLMDVPGDILADSVAYLQISFGGLVFLLFYNVFTSYLRALGDSKNPLYILIGSTVLNVLLDLYFVIRLGMGVAGAAWATMISQALASVVCVLYAFRKVPALRITRLIFDRRILSKILQYSIPSALQLSFVSLAGLTIQRLVNGFGAVAIAGYTAATKIDNLALMPLGTFSMAESTLVAQNIGAGLEDRSKQCLKASFFMMLGLGVAFSLFAWSFGKELIALFVAGEPAEIEAVLTVGAKYLSIIVSFYPLFAVFFAFNGFFRGVGDATVVMLLTVFSLILRSLFAHVLIRQFAMGPEAVAWSIPVGWGVCTVIAYVYYRKRLWAGKSVREGE